MAKEQKTLGTFVEPYTRILVHGKQCCLHTPCFIVDDGFLYGADVIFIIIISYFAAQKQHILHIKFNFFSCFFSWLAFHVHWRVLSATMLPQTHNFNRIEDKRNECVRVCVCANI